MRQLKITKSITNRESESLEKYLSEIGREELLSTDESEPRAVAVRPHQRGQPWTDQGCREIRRDTRLQVHLICRLVDTSEHSAGHC